ncbi:MAG TPA: ribbon-helix-helix domain-containing protein [Prosthecobacter sp.]|nr:ribbon-helix-helix domain-containing protein [Prosthecobacter sp.]HRK16526.1 ribbon-helix-helix domain-containing protein [Prosthecobacter sp.]
MKKSATRITVTLPPELDEAASKVSLETGVSISDLMRQGMIRIITERLNTGNVTLLQLPPAQQAA